MFRLIFLYNLIIYVIEPFASILSSSMLKTLDQKKPVKDLKILIHSR